MDHLGRLDPKAVVEARDWPVWMELPAQRENQVALESPEDQETMGSMENADPREILDNLDPLVTLAEMDEADLQVPLGRLEPKSMVNRYPVHLVKRV